LVASGSTGAGVTTANVTGLSPATTYSFYVRSNCGDGDFSVWTSAGTFNTLIANDTCSTATLLASCSGAPQTLNGTTTGAALDTEYVNCGVGGTTLTERGVWYKYIGDNSQVTVNTCATTSVGYDTRLTV